MEKDKTRARNTRQAPNLEIQQTTQQFSGTGGFPHLFSHVITRTQFSLLSYSFLSFFLHKALHLLTPPPPLSQLKSKTSPWAPTHAPLNTTLLPWVPPFVIIIIKDLFPTFWCQSLVVPTCPSNFGQLPTPSSLRSIHLSFHVYYKCSVPPLHLDQNLPPSPGVEPKTKVI